MNITKRIHRDIDIYNGVTPQPEVTPSFSIFTYTNLKIIVILLVIILVIRYIYTIHLSTKDYKKTLDIVVKFIKSVWNNFISFINKGIHSMPALYGDEEATKSQKQKQTQSKSGSSATNDTTTPSAQLSQQQQQNKSKELDTIKTALDTNALKYVVTREETKPADDIPGWCYIGKDISGVRVCAKANNESLCESNLFYQKEEQCINQPDDV